MKTIQESELPSFNRSEIFSASYFPSVRFSFFWFPDVSERLDICIRRKQPEIATTYRLYIILNNLVATGTVSTTGVALDTRATLGLMKIDREILRDNRYNFPMAYIRRRAALQACVC